MSSLKNRGGVGAGWAREADVGGAPQSSVGATKSEPVPGNLIGWGDGGWHREQCGRGVGQVTEPPYKPNNWFDLAGEGGVARERVHR